MRIVYSVFSDRIDEIDIYFEALKQLYHTQNTFEEQYLFHNEDFLKILKANALLMIYNLVESSVLGGIIEIYEEFKSRGLSYNDVSDEIQSIWFSYKFNQVYDKKAHYNSYKDKALDIINSILTGKVIELDRKATNISGNLDAENIRRICSEHGIQFQCDTRCRGGIVLEDVKNKRNELAHGTISFAECGREYSILDLEKIKNEAIMFLKGLIDGMNDYYTNQEYLCS
ncbi:MAG: MAE_28990/MAE_18760 family HEPN-like nuclease [Rickettsiales bacterium]|jgi:hypothetical protein|nr:MAE_28990/MAE_18760 family HEPN-like nuclease [Rickettsiales bacterium]